MKKGWQRKEGRQREGEREREERDRETGVMIGQQRESFEESEREDCQWSSTVRKTLLRL